MAGRSGDPARSVSAIDPGLRSRRSPLASSKTPPLTLNFESAQNPDFRPEGVSDDYLREALGPPTFFHKIIVAQCDQAVKDRVAAAADTYFGGDEGTGGRSSQTGCGAVDRQRRPARNRKSPTLTPSETICPSWLTWRPGDGTGDEEQRSVSDSAHRAEPEVLARYNNDLPMLLRRRRGRGQVLFLTTSLSREWTTLYDLPQSAWLMDRIARCVLSDTLSAWNVSSEKSWSVLPVAVGGTRSPLLACFAGWKVEGPER